MFIGYHCLFRGIHATDRRAILACSVGTRSYTLEISNSFRFLTIGNPFNMSYITGIGDKSVMNIHHRPSIADKIKEPYPGLLAGGPNRQRRDDVLKKLEFGTPNARCFADDLHSYASNEIAINWNAPLAFVLAAFLPDYVRIP